MKKRSIFGVVVFFLWVSSVQVHFSTISTNLHHLYTDNLGCVFNDLGIFTTTSVNDDTIWHNLHDSSFFWTKGPRKLRKRTPPPFTNTCRCCCCCCCCCCQAPVCKWLQGWICPCGGKNFVMKGKDAPKKKTGGAVQQLKYRAPLVVFFVHKRGDYTIYTEVLGRIFGSHLEFLGPFWVMWEMWEWYIMIYDMIHKTFNFW